MQQYYNQVDIEESIGVRGRHDNNQLYDDDCSMSSSCDKISRDDDSDLKKPRKSCKQESSLSSPACEKSNLQVDAPKPLKNLDDAAAEQQEDEASCTSDHLHRASKNLMIVPKGTGNVSPIGNYSATPRHDIHGILSQIESEEINQN